MATKRHFEILKAGYAELWHNMDIDPARRPLMEKTADRIIANRAAYQSLQNQTGVPWWFIGLVHLRESNLDFETHLHNGDPLTARTVHEPKGYPKTGTPPFSFEYSAIDAIKKQGYDKIKDWGIERTAYSFEDMNGFGYRNFGVNSPYLWAGTDNYDRGKYIRDHVFDPGVKDTQLGVMPVLKIILEKTGTTLDAAPVTISPTADAPRPTTKQMNKTSRKFYLLDWLKWITGIGGVGTGTAKVLDANNVAATKTYVDTLKNFGMEYGALIVVIALIGAFAAFMLIQKWQKDDVEEGRAISSGEAEE